MSELEMKAEVETEDFADELSDEALDRAEVRYCGALDRAEGGYCYTCSSSSCG
jgi:hypothetical protein